jgi:hypothetical protein
MRLNCLFLLLFLFFLDSLRAQDTILSQPGMTNTIAFYYKYIGENAHLYNGSEHGPYDFRIAGHPYYVSNLLQPGYVYYDGTLYSQVNLALDIVRDELTINRFNNNFRMRLATEKVSYFSLLNHFFVRLVLDSTKQSTLPTGFYDRLYNGHIKFYAKRHKKIDESITPEEGDKLWFTENDLFYIYLKDRYYLVKNKKELFNIFKDRKKDLKKFLRKNKLDFKDDPEATILRSVEYCNQLMN